MSNLRNKLIENIVAPVANSHSAISLEATVISANEKTNKCKISYVNEKGIPITEEEVPIQMQNISIIDWFPKKRETVLISIRGKDVSIVGPSYGKSYGSIRSKLELKEDIYNDASNYTMGGFIF